MGRKVRIAVSVAAVGCALALLRLFGANHAPAPSKVEADVRRPDRSGAPLLLRAPRRDASVSGHVWTKAHQPIAEARVCAMRASSDPTGIDAQSCTSTDVDGAFRLIGLRAETYRLVASATGFAPALAADTGQFTLQLGATLGGVKIYLDREGTEISGHVVDATGGPVPGAKVRIVRWQAAPLVTFVETDQAGRFAAWTSPGEVTLTASADGYATSPPLFRTAPSRNVELSLIPGATVRGFVVTAQGERPVVGAEVSATPLNSPMRSAVTISDEHGGFVLTGLEPTHYGLFASAPGFSAAAPRVVSVELGQEMRDVVLTMSPGAQVNGTVLIGTTRTACTQGTVTLGPHQLGYPQTTAAARPSGRMRDATLRFQTTIESDGRVHFDAVPAARYFALVNCVGSRQQEGPHIVEVGDADVEDLVFRVEPSPTLTIRVVDEANQPVAGAQVMMEWPQLAGPPGRKSALTVDSRGEYHFTSGLAPGVYRLAPLRPYEGEAIAVDLTAAASRTDAVVRLRGSAAIAVTVRDAIGEPADGLTVIARRVAESAHQAASPSEPVPTVAAPRGLGVYRAGPLAPGRYVVEVTDGVNPPIERGAAAGAEAPIEVVAGRQSEISVTVARDAQIRGTVVDASGAPVSNVWVSVASEAALAKLPFGTRQLTPPARRALTEPDGTFALAGLDRSGSYSVRAEEPDGSSVKVQRDVAPGAEITIALPSSSRVAGKVFDEQGKPLDSFVIKLAPAELDQPRILQFSRANGRFSVDRVPPGKLRLSASDGAGRLAHSEIEIGEGAAREDLRLTLHPIALRR